LAVLVQELKGSVTSRIDQILEKLEKGQEENKRLHDSVQKLSLEVEKHSKQIEELRSMSIASTNSAINSQEQKNTTFSTQDQTQRNTNISQNDRGIRRNNIIITGIEVGNNDPRIFLQAFISARFATRPDGVLAVQRILSKNDQSSNSSPRYLVTMKSALESQLIYNQRLQVLRDEKIYISEDLTAAESRLFYKARQLKKMNLIHSTWTKEGKTYIRKAIFLEPEEFHEGHSLLQTSNTIMTQVKPIPPFTMTTSPSQPSSSSSDQVNATSSSSNHASLSSTQANHKPATANHEVTNEVSDECLQLVQGAITRAMERQRKAKKSENTSC